MNKKFDVTFPDEVVAVIEDAVASGQFASSEEMLIGAVQAWQRSQEERAETLASIKARIQQSLDDPRPLIPIDEAFARLRANVKQRYKNR